MNNLIIVLMPLMISVESGGKTDAIGDGGKAVGALQLHKIYVDEVNRILTLQDKPLRFNHSDRYDLAKSTKMTFVFLNFWGRQYEKETGKKATIETLARIQNGGPDGWKEKCTEPYWEKIKEKQNEVRKHG